MRCIEERHCRLARPTTNTDSLDNNPFIVKIWKYSHEFVVIANCLVVFCVSAVDFASH